MFIAANNNQAYQTAGMCMLICIFVFQREFSRVFHEESILFEQHHEKNLCFVCAKTKAQISYLGSAAHLYFRFIDGTIHLLPGFKHLAIYCSCTAGFVSDWSENPKTGFLMTRLCWLI